MEEEFNKKSSKNILKILIPIVILVILIGAGLAYYFISNTPKNIFAKAVDGVFDSIKQEEYETLKSNVEVSMNIESDNSDIKSVGQIISNVKLKSNQEIDLNNKIVNEAIAISYSGEELLNLECIIEEETAYVFLQDLFSKYIEIPLDEIGLEEDIFTTMQKTKNITDKAVLSEVNKIIKAELKDKTYKQEKEELLIDGETVKTTKSTLILTSKEANEMIVSILNNIKENDRIMTIFEDKEEAIDLIEELIEGIEDSYTELSETVAEISIYTKGILNKEVVRVELNVTDDEQEAGLYITKISEDNYLFVATFDEEELFNVNILEEKEDRNSGKITIKFDLSNLIQGTGINEIVAVIKAKYNVEYDTKIEIPEFTDSVELEKMTEQDANEIMVNAQKVITKLGEILVEAGIIDTSELYQLQNLIDNKQKISGQEEIVSGNTTVPEVTYDNYKVKYNVPAGFMTSAYNTPDYKYYSDENLNSVTVTIEKETKNNYLEFLKESYSLTSDLYENQEISGIKTLNIGGKEFSYRTITYTNLGYNYTESYYCYELGDGYLYVVEADIEDGTVLETELNKFLEIQL